MFGIGSLAQYYLSTGVFGSYLSVNISWGLGVTFGVFWSFGISGMYLKLVSFLLTPLNHLNLTVTAFKLSKFGKSL